MRQISSASDNIANILIISALQRLVCQPENELSADSTVNKPF